MRRLSLVGVDVSDSSIKVLQLSRENSVLAYGSGKLDAGVIQDGRIVNKEAFSEKLKEILQNTKPNVLYSEESLLRAVLCLPESNLYTHYLTLPQDIKKNDIRAYIEEDAKKIIPFELDDLYWDFSLVGYKGEQGAVFAGVTKANLDSYVEAFTLAEVKPARIVGELFSLGKALLPLGALAEEEGHMIVDIGAHTTNIGVFNGSDMALISVTVPMGGDKFTEVLSEKLGISKEKAEELKKDIGLKTSSKESEAQIGDILKECMQEVIDSILETKSFFEAKASKRINHLTLAGGSALLLGIAPFLKEKTQMEVHIADPLSSITNKDAIDTAIPGIFFANVVGLALQSAELHESDINLLTQYRYNEDTTDKERLSFRDIRSSGDLKYVAYSFFEKIKAGTLHIAGFIKGKIHIDLKLLFTVVIFVGALGFLFWVLKTYTGWV